MTKRALFAVAGFLGFCFSLSAQEAQHQGVIQLARFTLNQPDASGVVDTCYPFGPTGIGLNNAYAGIASLTLANARFFSFPSTFAWMEATPVDFLPVFTAEGPGRMVPAVTPARDSGRKAVDLLPKFDYASGEVGVFYGKSTGKFGREVKQGYILGEMGDDKTHITVGASYEETSGRVPRLGH